MNTIFVLAIAFACLIAAISAFFVKQRWWIKLLVFIGITFSLLWMMFMVLLILWPGGHN